MSEAFGAGVSNIGLLLDECLNLSLYEQCMESITILAVGQKGRTPHKPNYC